MSARRLRIWGSVLLSSALVLSLLTACGTDDDLTGNVAGLPITHFESGFKANAPQITIPVRNNSGNEVDRLASATMEDASIYWSNELLTHFDGMEFKPISSLLAYEANGENQETACTDTKKLINAFYCGEDDSIAWDRGILLPMLLRRFGPMAVVGVMAHEFGHAMQYRLLDRAGITPNVPVIVKEQQADCFAGSYLRWVAEGNSKFYRVSTAEGLGQVLSSLYLVRDEPGQSAISRGAHGSGFDRTYAFQRGFENGSANCAKIDLHDVNARITEVPYAETDTNRGDSQVDQTAITALQESLDQAFAGTGAQGPRILDQGAICPNGPATPPTSYCPATNTVTIDLPMLAQLGLPVDQEAEFTEAQSDGGRGDFAAFSEIASRYVQGIQKAVGAPLDNNTAGLRTACLVGAWAQFTNQPGGKFRLSAGDLDEAISDLLQPDSLVAADINGRRVDSSFARVAALRKGYLQGSKTCTDDFG